MSTESNAALAWLIEPTEFAAIGDHVARLYSRTAEDTDPDQHYGAFVWNLPVDERPMFSLLGTTWPGKLYAYTPWCEGRVSTRVDREFAEIYARAGFRPDPRNSEPTGDSSWFPPVVRPCIGDPRLDPIIR
jgi:hypothetical protein